MTARILIVEDEKAIQIALGGLLRREGYQVQQADSGEAAIAALQIQAFDLVLTDLALGKGKSGMDVLESAKAARPDTAVVMITAHGSEKIAVQAMKSGADDYLPKPFDNDELRVIVARALERYRLARENRLLLEQIQRAYGFENLIGSSDAMRRVFGTIQKVAETDLTVLVLGRSGTGKELVAQAIHDRSSRKGRPFVVVNCAAISRELVESELFGHEKGAFTGADRRRTGRFEAADGGTVLLDEIGDMPLETQAKVLRVLQERAFERVGGNESIEVDVRVVAATHRDLRAEVQKGRFREDLYYRLKVVEIELPPLGERTEDIPALCEHFLKQLSERLGRDRKRLSPAAAARLLRYPWPGNVRELRNAIERAAVLSTGEEIGEIDLELDGSAGAGTAAGEQYATPTASAETGGDRTFAEAKRSLVERFEREFILTALRQNSGNVSRTAQAIGMVRQNLQQKIQQLGLRSADWGQDNGKGE